MSYVDIPANNGQVQINVPSNAGVGQYDINVTYTGGEQGQAVCQLGAGKIVVSGN